MLAQYLDCEVEERTLLIGARPAELAASTGRKNAWPASARPRRFDDSTQAVLNRG